MNKERLDEILDFAVEREREAIDFYRMLRKRAEFSGREDFLAELERMEQGHIRVIENIRSGKTESSPPPAEVHDLKISEFLVEVEPSGDMSYQDILVTAMKREEKSRDLYTRLAEAYKADEAKNLFRRLAAEEAKHKRRFEIIYDEDILAGD